MCDCDEVNGEFFKADFEAARRIVTSCVLFDRDDDYLAIGQLVEDTLSGLEPGSGARRERFLMMMVSLVVTKLGELTDDATATQMRAWLLKESVSSD